MEDCGDRKWVICDCICERGILWMLFSSSPEFLSEVDKCLLNPINSPCTNSVLNEEVDYDLASYVYLPTKTSGNKNGLIRKTGNLICWEVVNLILKEVNGIWILWAWLGWVDFPRSYHLLSSSRHHIMSDILTKLVWSTQLTQTWSKISLWPVCVAHLCGYTLCSSWDFLPEKFTLCFYQRAHQENLRLEFCLIL